MTARLALMRSDNNATISLASMVGFDRVAALARDAGIKSARGTPSMAIGSYDATPLDMAGAYTVFANDGCISTHGCWPACARQQATSSPTTRPPPSRFWTARCLSDHEHDGSGAARQRARWLHDWRTGFLRNRRRRPQHGIHRTGRGQNRHQATMHGSPASRQQSAVHRVGRQRRLYSADARARRRARRRAHLGRLHEEGSAVAAILRHPRLHAARRRGDCAARQGHQPAQRRSLPGQLQSSLPRLAPRPPTPATIHPTIATSCRRSSASANPATRLSAPSAQCHLHQSHRASAGRSGTRR